VGWVSSENIWVAKSEFGTCLVNVNPNGLSEDEILLKPSGVPVMGATVSKGCSEPVEFIES
jgi:hypothetical protein